MTKPSHDPPSPGALRTNTIKPATGASVTIDGNLIITGSSVHAGLETYNGDIATDAIFSTNPSTTSVNVPGAGGLESLQIGVGGTFG